MRCLKFVLFDFIRNVQYGFLVRKLLMVSIYLEIKMVSEESNPLWSKGP